MRRWSVVGALLFSQFASAQEGFVLQSLRDVVIYGAKSQDTVGWNVKSTGDVNGDGFDDFVFETTGRDEPPETGYLIFGATDLPAVIDLNENPQGLLTQFPNANRIGDVGDFNGDGFEEVALADVGYDLSGVFDVGQARIVLGTSGFPAAIDFSSADLPGYWIQGHRSGEWVGNDMRAIGDVNGDGFDDFGFQGWRVRGNNIAEVVFIFGGTDVPDYLSTEDLGEHGSIIISAFPADQLGDSFAPAGDVNGDGFDDVIMGANAFEPEDPDRAYLVFGGTDLPPLMNVGQLGNHGVRFEGGSSKAFGFEVSGAGDVNRDGLSDILIVRPGESPNNILEAGETYLIFGSRELPTTVDVDSLGSRGITIQGYEEEMHLAQRLSGSADWNGDEYPDNAISPSNLWNEIDFLMGGAQYTSAGSVTVDELDPVIIYNPLGTNNYPNVMRFGDINGDGYDDLIIGEEFGSILKEGGGYERFNCGMVHIVYGSPEKFGVPTPTPTPIEVGDFSGWVLLGTGEVVRTTPLTPTPTE